MSEVYTLKEQLWNVGNFSLIFVLYRGIGKQGFQCQGNSLDFFFIYSLNNLVSSFGLQLKYVPLV